MSFELKPESDAIKPHRRVHDHTRDDWRTPRPFFKSLDDRWAFTGDACASSVNHLADNYFTAQDCALRGDWSQLGPSVFMNPPYSVCGDFVERAYRAIQTRQVESVVALIPSAMDVSWVHEYVLTRASEIWCVRGRISFIDPVTEQPMSGNPIGSIVVAWSGTHDYWAGPRIGSLDKTTGRPRRKRDRLYWDERSVTKAKQIEFF